MTILHIENSVHEVEIVLIAIFIDIEDIHSFLPIHGFYVVKKSCLNSTRCEYVDSLELRTIPLSDPL